MIAILSGVSLFVLKYQVKAEEELLQKTHREILQTKREIHMLEAEWAYLNDPQRLLALVESQTDWQVITPTQLVALSDIPTRPKEEENELVESNTTDEPVKKPQKEFVKIAPRKIEPAVKKGETIATKPDTKPETKSVAAMSLSDLAQNAKALTNSEKPSVQMKSTSKLKGNSQKDFVWSPAKQKTKKRSNLNGSGRYAQ